MKINNNIAKKLKKDFPIFKNNPGLIYLDNAATSQRPKQVIKAVTDFYEKKMLTLVAEFIPSQRRQ